MHHKLETRNKQFGECMVELGCKFSHRTLLLIVPLNPLFGVLQFGTAGCRAQSVIYEGDKGCYVTSAAR